MALFFRTASEFVLMIAALVFLYGLASPLGDPEFITGRGDRYLAQVLALTAGVHSPSLLPVALASQAARVLGTLAMTGWAVLVIGRFALPAGATLALCIAMWLAGIAALPLSLMEGGHQTQAAVAAALALAVVPFSARASKTAWQVPQQAARVWLFPLWVLLTGLGFLWLLDFAARAHEEHKFIGVSYFYGLVLATVVLTMGASIAPTLLRFMAKLLARLDGLATATTHTRKLKKFIHSALPRLGLLAVMVCFCTAVLVTVGLGHKQSALRAELIRAAACIFIGWLAYRWLDGKASTTASPKLRGLLMMVLMALCVALPMKLGGDNGQIMLLVFAGALLLGALMGLFVMSTSESSTLASTLALCLGVSVAVTLLSVACWGLYTYGHLASPTVALRLAALQEAFSSVFEYLSELLWFMANAPPSDGFGIATTPWCGTLASLSGGSCPGISRQVPYDYVMAALTGLWGAPAALAIAVATACWLLGLTHHSASQGAAISSPERLAQWVVLVFVAITLIQLFVTSLASVGGFPLTGVNFPLLSHGKAGLIVTAFFAALALNKPATHL